MNDNVDAHEINHFDTLAEQWWDPRGPMATLHEINPARLRYLHQRVGALQGLSIVDVGCGGGILAQALAAAGAQVTGIDLAEDLIDVARHHAEATSTKVEYRVVAAEALAAEQPGHFDLVCCMEMLEHVPEPASVVSACATLARPGGHVMFSTINRNPKSYALMIGAAEYALRLVPRGTHDYGKFIRPSELAEWARAAGLDPTDLCGMRYNPLLRHASLTPQDVGVNYLMHCQRPATPSRTAAGPSE
ncbi:MAG TPA: bifunctional 2-polyprenyl-6-hydroxyphenol methylase/3-demethylubiquinol 3-O-methyltransferase UbiG [Nevskiaceae bacterium]|nr:bifunctional 2-polyprenyl-6-hydroxyphenol methylase/3-demethylubiquinol 3-O-methyltransferase UbiG [Nevskiaceae bacterium]